MKRLITLLICVVLVMALASCGGSSTVASGLLDVFEKNADKSAQEIADLMINDESIPFMGMTMPVEEGLLNGFGNEEITGFSEGVMFGPAIGTIPFIGYVFTLSSGTDADAFVKTLNDNADLRWNICTEADELVVESKGDKVVVIMSPESFEDAESDVEDEVPVYGDEFVDTFE
ncbi:MAG: hypothetical protein IJD68_05580 [Ruminococcus sp.]|nr:hypothetical protein [Ruminococcus sp.]